MSICWVWIPGESVGPFRIGERADPVIWQYELVKLQEEEYLKSDWDTYEVPNYESCITVRNGLIVTILCCDSLLYMGRDLLGLTLDEVRSVLGEEDELKEPWGAVYYHPLGLTLWFDEGVVESATCEAPYQSGGDPNGAEGQ